MKDFFLKVWAKNVGAHYTQEYIIHRSALYTAKYSKS